MGLMNRLNVERMLSGRRQSRGRFLLGIEDLDAKLSKLKAGAANKIARPALMKAARALLKQIKQDVPSQYKDAKRGLGMAVDQKGGRSRNQVRAKVGAGVGIRSKQKEKINAKTSGKRGGRPGVGMGPNNIHWFILGADGRSQGGPPRSHKAKVKSTGVMKPLMPNLIKHATNRFSSEMKSIISQDVRMRLDVLANS